MEIKIIYLSQAQQDLLYWKKSGNKRIQQRIIKLIQSISDTPFEGLGKPEPLKHDYAGWWSRRINDEHRLVYQVEKDTLLLPSYGFIISRLYILISNFRIFVYDSLARSYYHKSCTM